MKTTIINSVTTVSVSIIIDPFSIACAEMDLTGDHWWLARLFVKKEHRGKGLGRELVSKLKENAKGLPIEVMPGGYDLTRKMDLSITVGGRNIQSNWYTRRFLYIANP